MLVLYIVFNLNNDILTVRLATTVVCKTYYCDMVIVFIYCYYFLYIEIKIQMLASLLMILSLIDLAEF